MDYLREINAFHDSLLANNLSTGQVALWHILMSINNKVAWDEWFSVANQTLEVLTGMSRKGVYQARNALVQKGYLEISTRGTKATLYHIIPRSITANSTQACTQDSTRNSTQDSTRNSATLNKQDETKRKETPPKAPKGAARFDVFWDAYPRKSGKDAARKAFAKRHPSEALLTEMLAAIAKQKRTEQWTKNGGQFIPHPATWLNQGRWMDEVQPGSTGHGYRENIKTDEELDHLIVDLDKEIENDDTN